MAENKTQENKGNVETFLNHVDNETRKQDANQVLKIMKKITGVPPKMWGNSIVGFGKVHYKYASGREGEVPQIGFSPRKQALTLYINNEIYEEEQYTPLLKKLGKHRKGKTCLYINKLSDVDVSVLEKILKASLAELGKYVEAHEGWHYIT